MQPAATRDLHETDDLRVLDFDGRRASYKDFVIIEDQDAVELEAPAEATLFVIESPANVAYETYAQRRR